MVNGKGAGLSNDIRLKSWAKKKQISQTLMLKLIEIAKELGDMEVEKSYRNTFYCFYKIKSSENSLYRNYCKNRFCPRARRITFCELGIQFGRYKL